MLDKDIILDFQGLCDQKAISLLFKECYKPLVYYAFKLIDDLQEAEDIAVDTFIKLIKKRLDFDNTADIRAFLYVATRNACYNYLNSLNVENRMQAEITYLSDSAEFHDDYFLMSTQLLHELYSEIDNLPRQCCQVFKLLFFQKKTTKQVSEILGLNIQTVRNQKTRAIEMLRTAIFKKVEARPNPVFCYGFIIFQLSFCFLS